MAEVKATAERVIDKPSDAVYAALADYAGARAANAHRKEPLRSQGSKPN